MNQQPIIDIYGADWCPDCKTTKAWLDKKQYTYTYHDIEVEGNEGMVAVAPGVTSIPIVKINDTVLIEPSLVELAAALPKKAP